VTITADATEARGIVLQIGAAADRACRSPCWRDCRASTERCALRSEATDIVGVGQVRDFEFVADNPGLKTRRGTPGRRVGHRDETM